MEACELRHYGTFSSIESLEKDLYLTGSSTNKVRQTYTTIDGTIIHTIVLEKYYFRNNSYASATITLINEAEASHAMVVTSGAGAGVFNISWGATNNYITNLKKVFLNYGFIEVEKV